MFFQRNIPVELTTVLKYSVVFRKIEYISLENIKKIWIKDDDVEYSEEYLQQKNLPYKWEDPLYMKMVHRFRNCNYKIAQFMHQIDPGLFLLGSKILFFNEFFSCEGNQLLVMAELIYIFNIDLDIRSGLNIMEFFAWISNMKGAYDILLLKEKNDDDATFLDLWQAKPIDFFYRLPRDRQLLLLDEFNQKERTPFGSFKISTMSIDLRK